MARDIRLEAGNGVLRVRGNVRLEGLNPDRVVVVIRKLFDIDVGTIWKAENVITEETSRATTFTVLAKTIDEWLEDERL